MGRRVALRYRLPAGSEPPLTDVVGHVVEAGATIRVRTKSGEIVTVAADDVLAARPLTEAPVRTSQIRNLEQAAALAWPGVEHSWCRGWLLRFGAGYTRRANSAVPLEVWADPAALPVIVDWYAERGAAPLVAAPDRLLRLPASVPVEGENLVMTMDLTNELALADVALAERPGPDWRRLYDRDVPVEVLTATIEGEVAFATRADAAVGRAAVTSAPDRTRWVGLSCVRVAEPDRGNGHARELCAALLAWGAERGASRAYVQVLTDNAAANALYESMGFRTQHRSRYVDARNL